MTHYKKSTRLAQANFYKNPHTGELIPPISLSTSYERDEEYQKRDNNAYIRDEQLNLPLVEGLCANIEHGKQALLFSSGVAAMIAPMITLPSQSHILIQHSAYYGIHQWLQEFASRQNLTYDAFRNTDYDDLAQKCKAKPTALVVIETPSNPLMSVIDIAKTADIVHQYGARLLVDSTLATPILTNPLTLGADYVGHSATKFLNGHSDVLAGLLVSNFDENDNAWNHITRHRFLMGCLPSGYSASQLLRGMRSLSLRMERHCDNAMAVAEFLERHDKINAVHYPGLTSHPHHDIASKQMRIGDKSGYGGVLSFQIGDIDDSDKSIALINKFDIIRAATSLGGMETLAENRYIVEGDAIGTPKNLIRLSVGIEDINDIISDLEQALRNI